MATHETGFEGAESGLDRAALLIRGLAWGGLSGTRPSDRVRRPDRLRLLDSLRRGRCLLGVDVACLGATMRLVVPGGPDPGAERSAAMFVIEGRVYRFGTIPGGEGFDPHAVPALGTWLCRGWLLPHPDRPLPEVLSTQEFLLDAEDDALGPDQIVTGGFEPRHPSDVPLRATLRGTGRRASLRGVCAQRFIGTNVTVLAGAGLAPSPNFRFTFHRR